MEYLTDFMDSILNWLEEGQFSFFEDLVAYIMVQLTIGKVTFMLWSIQFSWGVAQSVLDQLSIGSQIEAIWAATDSVVLSWLSFFKIPQALNMIMTAGTTKFVMRMVGL